MVAGIRRAAFAFALLTTAAGAAPRASAQSSLSRPGRSGSGAILWFARAFPNLDMELYAESGQAQGVRVSVMVYWAKDAKDHCFLAPADLRVGFGGKAMRLARQGHPYGPTSISGVSFQLSNCAPAVFTLDDAIPLPTDEAAVVTLDQGGSHAEMRVATFFQPRRLELAGGARLRAGVRVSARWLPTSDEWSGYDASTVVEIRRDRRIEARIEKRQGLRAGDGRFDFVIPALPAGPAELAINLGYLRASPAIESCRGVHRCYADRAGVPGSPPAIDVQIVE